MPQYGDYRIVEFEDGRFYPQIYRDKNWQQVPDVGLYYQSLAEAKQNIDWYKRKTTVKEIHKV